MEKLLSTKELSQKWGISSRRIALLCSEGRVVGAQRVGASWGIPESAEKPLDARIKSGKYNALNAAGACGSWNVINSFFYERLLATQSEQREAVRGEIQAPTPLFAQE